MLVRWGAVAAAGTVALGVARMTGVAGAATAGREATGRVEKASKSDRWFAKVFWD